MALRNCKVCGLKLNKKNHFMKRWCSVACYMSRAHRPQKKYEEPDKAPLVMPPDPGPEFYAKFAPPSMFKPFKRQYEVVLTWEFTTHKMVRIIPLKATTPEGADEEGFAIADRLGEKSKYLHRAKVRETPRPPISIYLGWNKRRYI